MPKNKKDETNLSLKDAYEEIGRSYRFFLNWRVTFLPRSTQNPARNLYPKFFSYPLSKHIPVSEKGTNVILQKGDILFASIDFRKAYLVHEEPPFNDLRPSPTFFVIRPKSELVTSYYLFLYLQSNTAGKYAERYKREQFFNE